MVAGQHPIDRPGHDGTLVCATVWSAGLADGQPRDGSGHMAITWRAGRIERIEHVTASEASARIARGAIDRRDVHAVPGFVDAHLHLTLASMGLSKVDLSACASRVGFESRIAAGAASLPDGAWLEAQGWDEASWGGALPDSSWLDAAGDRPAVAYRMDIHACVVNDVVLRQLAREGALDSDPPGGTIVRDASGAPTGLLLEQAAWMLVNPRVPVPDAARRHAALLLGVSQLLGYGVTAVGSMEYAREVREVLLPVARLPVAMPTVVVTLLDRTLPLDLSVAQEFRVEGRLKVIGAKSFADGTLGSRTAAMLEPYIGTDSRGSLIEHAHDGTLVAWMRAVTAAGLSPSIHAIGDAAVRATLDAADAAGVPRGRLRIEHVQTISDQDLPRMAGAFASMQPLHAASDMPGAAERLGAHRTRLLFRCGDIARAGATLAFGSDWPVVPPDPMRAIRSAFTGRADDGRVYGHSLITVEEALVAHTEGAARCLELWPECGSLAPGARADIALLDSDPLRCDWDAKPPRVCGVVLGGEMPLGGRA
ncbi:MAG: amidohydrolase [Phycisphaerales bacterium]|nr:amidohydrolase [Phycisphaerales bacterium]